MGFLDDVMGMAGMNTGAQAGQHAGTLTMLLECINSPQIGGIAGLQHLFQQKGLGGLVASWIGTGQNLPVSADQLQNVLHSDMLQGIAAKTGVDTGQLTSILSQMLPQVINKMTPNGKVPASNSILDMANGLGADQA